MSKNPAIFHKSPVNDPTLNGMTMVYEFQLDRLQGTSGASKNMVEIQIPFSTIVSLWVCDRDMRVEVKEAPKCYLGNQQRKNAKSKHHRAVYDRRLPSDITDGQLTTVAYHYVQFRFFSADHVKTVLSRFDPRFDRMLSVPFIEDPSKSLKPETRQSKSQLLASSTCLPVTDNVNNSGQVRPSESRQEMAVSKGCACTHSCSAAYCNCCIEGTTCIEGICVCVNCRNPLNILKQLGLPVDKARKDPCLMENIYKIQRLEDYVKNKLILECCNVPAILFNCIPGVVRCVSCSARYKYSWCTARLMNEDCTPRNHCVKCRFCTDKRNVHCQRCNMCYSPDTSYEKKCPVCM